MVADDNDAANHNNDDDGTGGQARMATIATNDGEAVSARPMGFPMKQRGRMRC